MRVTAAPIPLDSLSDRRISEAMNLLRIVERAKAVYARVRDPRAMPALDLARAGLVSYVISENGKLLGIWIPKRQKREEKAKRGIGGANLQD